VGGEVGEAKRRDGGEREGGVSKRAEGHGVQSSG
jgi:hypothetical protein